MSCDIAHVTLIMIVVRQCNGLKQISIRQLVNQHYIRK